MSKRYYLDTEFLDDGDHQRIVLISIGIVCSDGRELYLVSNEFDYDEVKRDDWMRDNVLAQLPPRPADPNMSGPWRTRAEIRDAIAAFIEDPGDGTKPEVWAYVASYDWVLFCQLFGKLINMPKHFPWIVNDLKAWATHAGYTGRFRDLLPDTGHHDALCDARWNRDVHEKVIEWLRARDEQNARQLADKLLADLNDRSGFSLDSEVREMIFPDWVQIIVEAP